MADDYTPMRKRTRRSKPKSAESAIVARGPSTRPPGWSKGKAAWKQTPNALPPGLAKKTTATPKASAMPKSSPAAAAPTRRMGIHGPGNLMRKSPPPTPISPDTGVSVISRGTRRPSKAKSGYIPLLRP